MFAKLIACEAYKYMLVLFKQFGYGIYILMTESGIILTALLYNSFFMNISL